jgi:tetratricopeptide (TPR) repeat protein
MTEGPQPHKSRVESEVIRIRRLMETSQFVAAHAASQALLADVPENRDVLYMLAVCQRYLRQLAPAFETLERLERLHPRFSRLFQERGHCHVAARDPGAALDAYLKAVNINPALPASWKALQVLFRAAGQPAEAETAAHHVELLAKLPAAIVTSWCASSF